MKRKRDSAASRPKSSPTGIGSVLESLKKRSKLGLQLEQARIWEQWDTLVGPKLCEHGRPRAIKEGRLVVDVDTHVSMHQFAYRKFAIIRRINAMARKELISDIFFPLGPDEAPTPARDEQS